MPGPLEKLADLARHALPNHSTANVLFRGPAVPVDRFLSGTARFAKKIESFIPIFVPDNYMVLSRDAQEHSSRLTVKTAVPGLEIGSIVKVQERELRFVDDVLTVDGEKVLVLDDELLNSYSAKDFVTLHSVPLQMHGDISPSSVDDTTNPDLPRLMRSEYGFGPILVKGNHYLYNGDKIAVLRNRDIIGSLYETEVTKAERMNVPGLKVTQVYLGSNVFNPANVFVDGYTLYLRAYPAYSSKRLKIPASNSGAVGPFLVDWMSGRLREGDEVPVIHTLRTFPSGGTAAIQDKTVSKNDPVLQVAIHRSSLLMFDLIDGTLNYRQGWTVGHSDSKNRFAISTILIPHLSAPLNWTLTVKVSDPCVLLYRYYPTEPVQVTVPAGSTQYIPITLGSDAAPAERFELAFRTRVPGTEILLGDMIVTGLNVAELEYDVVARETGRYSWASSGLLVKPLFKTIHPLAADTSSARTNNGTLLSESGV